MAGQKYFLTAADLRKQKSINANVRAGKGVLSKRPTATRRRFSPGTGAGWVPRLAVVTETGGIAAATLSGSDVVPASGEGTLLTRPATPGDDWTDDSNTTTLYNLDFAPVAENARVWIDSEGYILRVMYPGYDGDALQSLGHDDSDGAPDWQDDSEC